MYAPQKHIQSILLILSLLVLSCVPVFSQEGYRKPPKEVLDILAAPVTPTMSLSPTRDNILLITGLRYPPLSDLAEPYKTAG